jgi:hypothetical protein
VGLFLPQRWKNQPQGPVTIDWGNPLTRGLIACANAGSGSPLAIRELVSNKHFPAAVATGAMSRTALGMRSWTGVQYYGTVYVDVGPINEATDNCEFATVFSTTPDLATNLAGNVRLGFCGNSNTNQIGLGAKEVSGTVRLNFRQGSLDDVTVGGFSAFTDEISSTTVLTPNRVHTAFAFVKSWANTSAQADGVEMQLGLNGKLEATARWAVYVGGTQFQFSPVGYQNDAGYFYNVFLHAMWKRLRSDAERREWHNNPWQILMPQRRVLYSLPNLATYLYSRPTADVSNTGWVRYP